MDVNDFVHVNYVYLPYASRSGSHSTIVFVLNLLSTASAPRSQLATFMRPPGAAALGNSNEIPLSN